jgi:hypothetical protein
MNKIKILILGFASISAASLCSAIAAAPPPVAEKVISFDAPTPAVSLELAVCDFDALHVALPVDREAVKYDVRQLVADGRTTPSDAKASARARTCSGACSCSHRSQPPTYYEQRM